jgi:hypothetical protein
VYCARCGQVVPEGSRFCPACGNPTVLQQQALPPVPPPSSSFAPSQPASTANGFSIAGIIMGAIAFLFFPIILGPAGLIMGAIGESKGETKAVVALVVSGLGLVIGMLLGSMLYSSSGF